MGLGNSSFGQALVLDGTTIIFNINGEIGLNFPILAPNGELAAPSYSFAGLPNYGIYYETGSEVADEGIVVLTRGAESVSFGASATIARKPIFIYGDSLAAPGLAFTSTSDGLCSDSTQGGGFDFVIAAVPLMFMRESSDLTEQYVGFFPSSLIQIPASGSRLLWIDTNGNIHASPDPILNIGDGSESAPAYSFIDAPTTGSYLTLSLGTEIVPPIPVNSGYTQGGGNPSIKFGVYFTTDTPVFAFSVQVDTTTSDATTAYLAYANGTVIGSGTINSDSGIAFFNSFSGVLIEPGIEYLIYTDVTRFYGSVPGTYPMTNEPLTFTDGYNSLLPNPRDSANYYNLIQISLSTTIPRLNVAVSGARALEVSASGVNVDNALSVGGIATVESGQRVACGGGSTGSTVVPSGTVTLEINGVTYYLLTASGP